VHRLLCRGFTDVVDADLSKYFDTIPHNDLLRSVAARIVDRHVLRLIKMWLKTPVEETDPEGRRRMSGGKHSNCGTPQGGVISPLLANRYMNRFLRHWRQQGRGEAFQAHVVAYADDFVILSRGYAEEALAWTRRIITRLGLTVNEAKTTVRKDGHWYLGASPSKKSVQRLKERVREITAPANTAPWEEVRDRLNHLLRGWANYFSYGTRLMAYRAADHNVYEAVRGFLTRRHKVPTRGTRRFSDHVVFEKLGVLRLRRMHIGAPSTVAR
jgi:RNA-directed DNA polymerase